MQKEEPMAINIGEKWYELCNLSMSSDLVSTLNQYYRYRVLDTHFQHKIQQAYAVLGAINKDIIQHQHSHTSLTNIFSQSEEAFLTQMRQDPLLRDQAEYKLTKAPKFTYEDNLSQEERLKLKFGELKNEHYLI